MASARLLVQSGVKDGRARPLKGYHDIAGDGGSNVLGQVAERRSRIEGNLADVRHVVAVGSGKGGVGKSTLALQIALALRKEGGETAILDADLNGPCQARLAGLDASPPVPGERGMAMSRSRHGIGVVSMGGLVPESRAVDLDDAVAEGDSWVWRATREFSVLDELLIGVDWGRLDFLLVDLPPGAERMAQYSRYFGPRCSFVLVTVPSDLSRGVVSRSAAALAKSSARVLGYVENMKGYFCDECRSVRPLFPGGASVDLRMDHLGSVPFDPALAEASDLGAALPLDRPSLAAIRDVALRVRRGLEETS